MAKTAARGGWRRDKASFPSARRSDTADVRLRLAFAARRSEPWSCDRESRRSIDSRDRAASRWQRKEHEGGRRSRSAPSRCAKTLAARARRVRRESERMRVSWRWCRIIESEAVKAMAAAEQSFGSTVAKAAAASARERVRVACTRKCHDCAVGGVDGAEALRGCTLRRACASVSKWRASELCRPRPQKNYKSSKTRIDAPRWMR